MCLYWEMTRTLIFIKTERFFTPTVLYARVYAFLAKNHGRNKNTPLLVS